MNRPGGPSPAAWVIAHPIADLPDLCEGLRVRVRGSDATVVVCDVGALPPDLGTVDALAHLELTARRLGHRIRLVGASPELLDLLALLGLAGVVGVLGVVGGATPPPGSPRGRREGTDERYPGSS